jgi:hypothetical protein
MDETLDVVFQDKNDVEFVTGRKAAEQAVRTSVKAFFDNEIGSIERETTLQRIELYTRRTIDLLGFLDDVSIVRAEFHQGLVNTAFIEIVYTTGETFSFTLN